MGTLEVIRMYLDSRFKDMNKIYDYITMNNEEDTIKLTFRKYENNRIVELVIKELKEIELLDIKIGVVESNIDYTTNNNVISTNIEKVKSDEEVEELMKYILYKVDKYFV